MPRVGFGTWRLNGTACKDAVVQAVMDGGVRHLDLAENYENFLYVG